MIRAPFVQHVPPFHASSSAWIHWQSFGIESNDALVTQSACKRLCTHGYLA